MTSLREKVVIIIPTYDEATLIADTIYALQAVLNALTEWECVILVFDSNSPDGTAQIIKLLQQQYTNLFFQNEKEKSGLGSAYIQAMNYAMETLGADLIIEYDADGSHQPYFIPPMLQLTREGYDVVSASRYIPGGSIPENWGIYRKTLSIVGNKIARLFLTKQYTDFTSGFRITRVKLLKKINLSQLLSKKYAYKIHLLWALSQHQARMIEYPIHFIDRKKGYSKLPAGTILDSCRVIAILWARKKLKRSNKI